MTKCDEKEKKALSVIVLTVLLPHRLDFVLLHERLGGKELLASCYAIAKHVEAEKKVLSVVVLTALLPSPALPSSAV